MYTTTPRLSLWLWEAESAPGKEQLQRKLQNTRPPELCRKNSASLRPSSGRPYSLNSAIHYHLSIAMPDIPVGSQIFDLVFHPSHPTVYTGLLNGEINSFNYDEQGNYDSSFKLRPTKKSCRGLTINPDGGKLWATGKAKAIQYVSTLRKFISFYRLTCYLSSAIDTITGVIVDTRLSAHE